MKKLAAMFVVVALLGVAGCGKTEGGGGGGGSSTTFNNPLPLSVGNWWAYVESDSTRDTLFIRGTTNMNGKEVFVGVSMPEGDTSYFYLENGYIHEIHDIENVGMVDMKFLKVPLSVGDQWSVYASSDTSWSFTMTAEADGTEDIHVPAGDFSTIRVVYTTITTMTFNGQTYADTTYDYAYYADNVGVVKSRDVGRTETNVSELENYHTE